MAIRRIVFRTLERDLSDPKTIQDVWEKGQKIKGRNPDVWREDDFGNRIKRKHYGKESEFGWEIDHIRFKSKGGSDALSNLRPLFWKDNRSRQPKSNT